MFKKISYGLFFLALLNASGCALSPYAPFLEIKASSIMTNPKQAASLVVGTITVGDTPGTGLYSMSIQPQIITNALQKNLSNYGLLANQSSSLTYSVDLNINFIKSGIRGHTVRGIGHYLITNQDSGSTTQITINEAYHAVAKIAVRSLVVTGLAGAAVGQTLATEDALVVSGVVGATVGQTLATEDSQKAQIQTAYAPENTPTTAYRGEVNIMRAYEGAIRLNIAHFIKALKNTQLP